MSVQIQFETGQEDRASKVYGPYDFVQATYESIRVGTDGDLVLASFNRTMDMWELDTGELYSDFVITEFVAEKQNSPYGEWCRDPKACEGKGYCPLDPTCGD